MEFLAAIIVGLIYLSLVIFLPENSPNKIQKVDYWNVPKLPAKRYFKQIPFFGNNFVDKPKPYSPSIKK